MVWFPRPGNRCVHTGSFACALGDVMFIRCRCVLSLAPWPFFVFWRGLWVHSRAPCGSLGSSRVVGITRARPGFLLFIRGRWVHSRPPWVSLSSSGVTRGQHWGRWLHPGSFGFRTLGVFGFFRYRLVHTYSPFFWWISWDAPWVHAGSVCSL